MAHPRDHVGTAVVAINRPVHIDDDAPGVGQDGEVAGASDRVSEFFEHRTCSLYQGLAGIGYPPHGLCRDGFEGDALFRSLATGQAAPPGSLDPGLNASTGSWPRRARRACSIIGRRSEAAWRTCVLMRRC
jgi:hypothetical protein